MDGRPSDPSEHSPSFRKPSNETLAPARRLARACVDVASAPNLACALERLLRAALELTGSERAFLVRGSPGDERRPCIDAVRSRRPDGQRRVSHTLVRRVLAGRGPLVASRSRDRPLVDGESVRALQLSSVLAAPLPCPPARPGEPAALLLDSRAPIRPHDPSSNPAELVSALAALAALALFGPSAAAAGSRTSGPHRGGLVGESAALLGMLDRIERVAPHPFPVLLTGESGSGKEGAARALHEASGRDGPFLAANCAAFPEALIESELFGARRGAYTGAERDRPGLFRRAHRGTLLLDEIGEMPVPMQAKLLRALQEKSVRPVGADEELAVDVRIVSATNRDLTRLIASGRFRDDLFHRLALVEVRVPPLRERLQDLPLLARHLVSRLSLEGGLRPAVLTEPALARLRSHSWPGNVRELEAVLVRALLRCRGAQIGAGDLEFTRVVVAQEEPQTGVDEGVPLERTMIVRALAGSAGNLAAAAARIGWSRQKLYRRMAALGIDRWATG